jgi:hypothetical protein
MHRHDKVPGMEGTHCCCLPRHLRRCCCYCCCCLPLRRRRYCYCCCLHKANTNSKLLLLRDDTASLSRKASQGQTDSGPAEKSTCPRSKSASVQGIALLFAAAPPALLLLLLLLFAAPPPALLLLLLSAKEYRYESVTSVRKCLCQNWYDAGKRQMPNCR